MKRVAGVTQLVRDSILHTGDIWGMQKGICQEAVRKDQEVPESSCCPPEKEELGSQGLGFYFWLCADSDHDLGE